MEVFARLTLLLFVSKGEKSTNFPLQCLRFSFSPFSSAVSSLLISISVVVVARVFSFGFYRLCFLPPVTACFFIRPTPRILFGVIFFSATKITIAFIYMILPRLIFRATKSKVRAG